MTVRSTHPSVAFGAAALLVLLAGCRGPLIPDGSGLALSGISEPAVVSVYAWRPRGLSGARAQGSGFCVGPDEVVTNAHVVDGATAVAVRFGDGRDRKIVAVIGEDPDADLVLLRMDPGPVETPPLRLHTAPLAIGARVRIVGSPAGEAQTAARGRVASGIVTFDVLDEAILLSADAAPGMSGSPVLDASNRVVGIVSRGTNVSGEAYMVPAARLQNLRRFAPLSLARWSRRNTRRPASRGRALFAAAAVAFEGGDDAQAIEGLAAAIRAGLAPAGEATAWYVTGDAYANLGRDVEAIDAYRRAISIRPRHALSRGALALALRRQGAFTEALVAYDHALTLVPTRARLHVGRGWTLMRLERAEEAAKAFQLGVRLEPSTVSGWTGRGAAALARGRLDEARTWALRATQLGPRVEQAWWVLAATEQRRGAYREAVRAWQVGLRLRPDEAHARFELGRSLLVLGRRADAEAAHAALREAGSTWADELRRLLDARGA